jgi:MarR family multiple gene transcriptional regulator MgrA
MIHPSQYQTARAIIQLGNTVTWLRNQTLQATGLTSSQSNAILVILRHHGGPITAGTLTEELGLSQSTVAGILKRLEAKSLISRQIDSKDARKVIIRLTEQGLQLESALEETALQTEHLLLQGMSEAEQAEFQRLLNRALDHTNAARESKGGRSHE